MVSRSQTLTRLKAPKGSRSSKSRQALRSLLISVATPAALTASFILLFGTGKQYPKLADKPFWLPPLWLVHVCSMSSASLMGLAGWLVWVDGGFNAESTVMYLAQASIGIVWHPLVLVVRSTPIGFGFCAMNFAALLACKWNFQKVNPFAADIVKICALLAAFLTIVTLKICFINLDELSPSHSYF